MKKIILLLSFTVLLLGGCATRNQQELNHSFTQGKADFQAREYQQAYANLLGPARNDNAEAQYAIGYMIYYGLGVKADHDEGKEWIERAEGNGSTIAKNALVKIRQMEAEEKFTSFTNQKNESNAYANQNIHAAPAASMRAVPINGNATASDVINSQKVDTNSDSLGLMSGDDGSNSTQASPAEGQN